jgi:transcriptional regulator with XRE-family HTH domain
MKDRLLKILKQYNLTSSRFADELGVQRSGISHILSGRNQPSFDFLVKLMKQYPEINPDWLIMGSGTMLRSAVKENIKREPGLFDQIEARKVQPVSGDSQKIKEEAKKEEVTNVTNIQQIVIFYPDGTFKPYLPVLNE